MITFDVLPDTVGVPPDEGNVTDTVSLLRFPASVSEDWLLASTTLDVPFEGKVNVSLLCGALALAAVVLATFSLVVAV